MNKVETLIEALPYINKYSGRIFVIKISGGIIQDIKNVDSICQDIRLLQNMGIKTVILHGGGPQADFIARKMGYPIEKIDGTRVTSEEILEIAKMVYGGKINIEIISKIRKYGGRGVGLSGVDGNIIVARREETKRIKNIAKNRIEEVNFGLVGKIIKVNPTLILQLIEDGYIPVISSLVADEDGNIYNVNADLIAEEIAKTLKAEKFINLTYVNGILKNPKNRSSTIPYLSIKQAKKMLKEKKIVTKGMIPKLKSCVSAVEGGVKSANILDGTVKHSLLLEIFTDKGSGTYVGKEDR